MESVANNLEETHAFSQKIVEKAAKRKRKNATVIALYGELGSGKTSFVQGAAKALGITATIISPTFVIERVYALRGKTRNKRGTNADKNAEQTPVPERSSVRGTAQKFEHLIHIDCYRLESAKELLELGWGEISKNPKNIIFIEWAEKIEEILPKDAVRIHFEHISEDKRRIIIKSET